MSNQTKNLAISIDESAFASVVAVGVEGTCDVKAIQTAVVGLVTSFCGSFKNASHNEMPESKEYVLPEHKVEEFNECTAETFTHYMAADDDKESVIAQLVTDANGTSKLIHIRLNKLY